MKKLPSITRKEVLKHLDYSPDTGLFTWKKRQPTDFPHDNFRNTWNRRCAGKIPGFIAVNGYRYIDLLGKRFLAHRLAWFITYNEWPKEDVDHINNDRNDNRLSNLRLASRYQNLQNAKIRSNNTSGYKGVSWRKDTRKWDVRIREHGGKYRYFGSFDTKEAAAEVCRVKREELHAKFANHG